MSAGVVLSEEIQDGIICKGCSGKLQFVPGTNHLKCPSCGMENEIAVSSEIIEEFDFEKFVNESGYQSEVQEVAVINCPGCGAQTTFDPNVVSDACPFCGSPHVIKNATSSHRIKPKAILPFAIDQEKAYADYRAWINKLKFVPNKFRKYAQQEGKLTGMYIPFWAYSANTQSYYTGGRGSDDSDSDSNGAQSGGSSDINRDNSFDDSAYAQKVIALKEKTEASMYTFTDYGLIVSKVLKYNLLSGEAEFKGHITEFYEEVLVFASKSLPKRYVEKLEPWHLKKLVPFNESYLIGFRTESYQVDLKEGFADAKIKMFKKVEQAVKGAIGTKNPLIYLINTVYGNVKFQHFLLPVWISAYQFKGKTYRFMINGHTGSIQGERPYSWIKLVLTIISIILGFVGFMWLLSLLVLKK
ncbi:MAG: hypothetical protein EPN88_11545 [Bacteroidetes bacterium]|nr:MAG: hypothetical protein EPN88_11545 [Bacteroidota bacterium]